MPVPACVTALLMLYPRAPMPVIVGTDIAHAVPLTLLAGVGHWFLGSVDAGLLISLLSGSIPGIILGSWLAARMPELVLRPQRGRAEADRWSLDIRVDPRVFRAPGVSPGLPPGARGKRG